jgi:hypothetical protein
MNHCRRLLLVTLMSLMGLGAHANASVFTVDEAVDLGAAGEILPQDVTPVLNLVTGFNLVSWHVDVANDSIAAIVRPVVDDLVQVLGFETAAIGPNGTGAKLYDPSLPDFINTLKLTDPRLGYWIKMSAERDLEVPGTFLDVETPLPLVGGFNLVSYLPEFADSSFHAVATVSPNLIQVLGFETPRNGPNGTGAKLYDPSLPDFINTLKVMAPQLGYWVKLDADNTLVYPTSGVVPAGKVVASALPRENQVHPTDQWVGIYGAVTLDGADAPAGTLVDVVDAAGNTAAWFEVHHAGAYGYLPVYLDDPATAVDEGAEVGELLTVRVNGAPTDAQVKWTEFGALTQINIETLTPSTSAGVPQVFALGQNYPNPFNPSTTISYDLPNDALVTVTIHNSTGQTVRELVREVQTAGSYSIDWNGRDESQTQVASGAYFYRMQAGSFEQTRRMLLIK